jgi:hypothetical protein
MCEVVDGVRDEFERSKLIKLFGKDAFYQTYAAVVTAYALTISDCSENLQTLNLRNR